MNNHLLICTDFDGTCTTNDFPLVGKPVPGALETLKELQSKGHKIILWTVRDGIYLREATDYLLKNGIILYGINKNPSQGVWSGSNKVHADIFIDDAALGCPLMTDIRLSDKPFVDWGQVHALLSKAGAFDGTFKKIKLVTK